MFERDAALTQDYNSKLGITYLSRIKFSSTVKGSAMSCFRVKIDGCTLIKVKGLRSTCVICKLFAVTLIFSNPCCFFEIVNDYY